MELEDLIRFETEGTTLEFKQEQYKFSKENKKIRYEFLKDILAFANADDADVVFHRLYSLCRKLA